MTRSFRIHAIAALCATLLTAAPASAGGKLKPKDINKLNALAAEMNYFESVKLCDDWAGKEMSGELEQHYLHKCGAARASTGDFAGAEATLSRMDTSTEIYELHGRNAWGILEHYRCDYDAALDHFYATHESYQRLGQNLSVPRNNIASIMAGQRKYPSAIETYRALIEAHPGDVFHTLWRLSLVDCLHAAGEVDEARAEAAALGRDDAAGMLSLLAILEKMARVPVLAGAVLIAFETWADVGDAAGLDAAHVVRLARERDRLVVDLAQGSGACHDLNGGEWADRAIALGLIAPLASPEPATPGPDTAAKPIRTPPPPVPPADRDGDGIFDAFDKCPDEPEVVNGVDDEDGCPDQALARVVGRQIRIEEKVHFEYSEAALQDASLPVLDSVAAILRAYPEIRQVRIEGHTDTQGSGAHNLRLSDGRAHAVRTYLITQGIAPDRLLAQGYGETRPLRWGTAGADHAANRRVEIFILRRD